MKTIGAPALAAIASGHFGLAQLVEMDLPDYFWRLNTSSWNLIYGGETYLGVQAAMGSIEPFDDGPGEIKGIKFRLPAVTPEQRATALATQIQGRAVVIYTAIFRPSTSQVLEAVIEQEGRLDTMTIVQTEFTDAAGNHVLVPMIEVTAESIGVDMLRPSGWQYTKQDQLRLHPGDMSFEYVVDQSDRQIVFPTANYFKK